MIENNDMNGVDPDAAPLVQRDRAPRRRLLPASVLLAAGATVLVLGIVVGAGLLYSASQRVTVPDLTGLTEGIARTQLAREGLQISTIERRFDLSPEGTVLSQDPEPDSVVARGTGVALVVSAGTEEFVMPDVVGMGINVARAQLEQRGLVVRIEPVPSDEVLDTVLETIPAPGSTVRTSDIIRIRVAAESTASSALLPFEMRDALFVLDPAPGLAGEVDAPLEVTRRLRSLLEASGAQVVVTRSVTETEVADPVRAERAAETTGSVTALISIEAGAGAPGGLGVAHSEDGQTEVATVRLADAMSEALAAGDLPVLRTVLPSDPILDSLDAPAVRIRIGSYAVPEDVAAFRDPTWSDTIARAIYRALGDRFAP